MSALYNLVQSWPQPTMWSSDLGIILYKIDLLVCRYLAISEVFCYAYCTIGIEEKQEILITTRISVQPFSPSVFDGTDYGS